MMVVRGKGGEKNGLKLLFCSPICSTYPLNFIFQLLQGTFHCPVEIFCTTPSHHIVIWMRIQESLEQR